MRSFRFRRTDPHTLAGAYALDALGASDRARFERHLSGCPACAQEARGLQEATARLSDTLATQPPEGMRERVLAAAAGTRQNQPAARPARTGPAGWPGRRWGIAIACGVLVIALVGGLAFHLQQQLNQDQARSRAIAAVLNAPDAAMMTVAASTAQGTGTIVMSHRARALVFTAARLPSLPSSERYELWLMGSSGPRAAGMLPEPRAGMTAPVIVSGLRTGDEFAVSAEPATGSRHPTSPMIMKVTLPS